MLLWCLEENGLLQGGILSHSDSESSGFSTLHSSAPDAQALDLSEKYRSHLRKDTCGASEHLAP